MVHQGLKGCVIVLALGQEHGSLQRVKEWITNASGVSEPRASEFTTHLVISDKLWTQQGAVVQDVLARKRDGQRIQIMNYEWLHESLTAKMKKAEKRFRRVVPGEEVVREEARNTSGLMKDLYDESTDVLSSAQQKILQKQQAQADDLKKDKEAVVQGEFQEYLKMKMSPAESAAVFRRGTQKAKQMLLSDNHHIYVDITGFTYDVTLTKVDTRNNKNERYNLVLQLFESHVEPQTYAFNLSFSGTKLPSTNNTVVALGSNFPTAFAAFKKTFQEHTGYKWDDRLAVAQEREKMDKLMLAARGIGEHQRSQLGIPTAQGLEDRRKEKYQYYPPSYGPLGTFEDGSHVLLLRQKRPSHAASSPEPDAHFMHGGNGDAPTDPGSSPPSHAAAAASTPGSGPATPLVRPHFTPAQQQDFHRAIAEPDEDGEILEPLAEPFGFGASRGGPEPAGSHGAGAVGWNHERGEKDVVQDFFDFTQGTDFTQDRSGVDAEGELEAFREMGADYVLGSVPGKRKDSPFESPARKRSKRDAAEMQLG